MKLVNPTETELNDAFADRIVGVGPEHPQFDWHDYCKDASAVLPWMEMHKDVEIHRVNDDGWQVSIMNVRRFDGGTETGVIAEAWEDTFPRACVIALLRSKGVSVEFTA